MSKARIVAIVVAPLIAGGLFTALFAQRTLGNYPYQSGQDLYEHVCQSCHMPDGKGAVGAGAYPPLAHNPKLQAGLYPVVVLLRGQKAMPPFTNLDDNQVAAVTNYIRTHFGNSFQGEITAAQVKALRQPAVKQGIATPG